MPRVENGFTIPKLEALERVTEFPGEDQDREKGWLCGLQGLLAIAIEFIRIC